MQKQVVQVVQQAQKKEEALKTLKKLGVLVPFDDGVMAFHGRVNTDGKEFVVKTGFNNAGKNAGHYNVNAISGLYAGSFDVAKTYSQVREKQYMQRAEKRPELWADAFSHGVRKGKGEVHKIVALKPNLFIFDLCKTYNPDDIYFNVERDGNVVSQTELNAVLSNILSPNDKKLFQKAVSNLASSYDVKMLLPKLFHKNGLAEKVLKDLQKQSKINKMQGKEELVFDDDIIRYIEKHGEDIEELTQTLAGSINVLSLLQNQGDFRLLLGKFQSNIDFVDNYPLNLNLFRAFLQKEQIVGVKQKIWVSRIINKNNFDEYFFFDTSQINTEKYAKNHEQKTKPKQEEKLF